MHDAAPNASVFGMEYQGGPYVEILGTQGTTPLAQWKVVTPAKGLSKAYDKTIKGSAWSAPSGNLKLQLPKNDKTTLGLAQPFLVFQVSVQQGTPLSITLVVVDAEGTRRRVILSSSFTDAKVTPLHCQVPFAAVARGTWLNLVLPLAELVQLLFRSASYQSLDSLVISGSCKIRRIFTLRDAPYDPSERSDHLSPPQLLPLPRGFDWPPGLEVFSQIVDARLLESLGVAVQGQGGKGKRTVSDAQTPLPSQNPPQRGKTPGSTSRPGSTRTSATHAAGNGPEQQHGNTVEGAVDMQDQKHRFQTQPAGGVSAMHGPRQGVVDGTSSSITHEVGEWAIHIGQKPQHAKHDRQKDHPTNAAALNVTAQMAAIRASMTVWAANATEGGTRRLPPGFLTASRAADNAGAATSGDVSESPYLKDLPARLRTQSEAVISTRLPARLDGPLSTDLCLKSLAGVGLPPGRPTTDSCMSYTNRSPVRSPMARRRAISAQVGLRSDGLGDCEPEPQQQLSAGQVNIFPPLSPTVSKQHTSSTSMTGVAASQKHTSVAWRNSNTVNNHDEPQNAETRPGNDVHVESAGPSTKPRKTSPARTSRALSPPRRTLMSAGSAGGYGALGSPKPQSSSMDRDAALSRGLQGFSVPAAPALPDVEGALSTSGSVLLFPELPATPASPNNRYSRRTGGPNSPGPMFMHTIKEGEAFERTPRQSEHSCAMVRADTVQQAACVLQQEVHAVQQAPAPSPPHRTSANKSTIKARRKAGANLSVVTTGMAPSSTPPLVSPAAHRVSSGSGLSSYDAHSVSSPGLSRKDNSASQATDKLEQRTSHGRASPPRLSRSPIRGPSRRSSNNASDLEGVLSIKGGTEEVADTGTLFPRISSTSLLNSAAFVNDPMNASLTRAKSMSQSNLKDHSLNNGRSISQSTVGVVEESLCELPALRSSSSTSQLKTAGSFSKEKSKRRSSSSIQDSSIHIKPSTLHTQPPAAESTSGSQQHQDMVVSPRHRALQTSKSESEPVAYVEQAAASPLRRRPSETQTTRPPTQSAIPRPPRAPSPAARGPTSIPPAPGIHTQDAPSPARATTTFTQHDNNATSATSPARQVKPPTTTSASTLGQPAKPARRVSASQQTASEVASPDRSRQSPMRANRLPSPLRKDQPASARPPAMSPSRTRPASNTGGNKQSPAKASAAGGGRQAQKQHQKQSILTQVDLPGQGRLQQEKDASEDSLHFPLSSPTLVHDTPRLPETSHGQPQPPINNRNVGRSRASYKNVTASVASTVHEVDESLHLQHVGGFGVDDEDILSSVHFRQDSSHVQQPSMYSTMAIDHSTVQGHLSTVPEALSDAGSNAPSPIKRGLIADKFTLKARSGLEVEGLGSPIWSETAPLVRSSRQIAEVVLDNDVVLHDEDTPATPTVFMNAKEQARLTEPQAAGFNLQSAQQAQQQAAFFQHGKFPSNHNRGQEYSGIAIGGPLKRYTIDEDALFASASSLKAKQALHEGVDCDWSKVEQLMAAPVDLAAAARAYTPPVIPPPRNRSLRSPSSSTTSEPQVLNIQQSPSNNSMQATSAHERPHRNHVPRSDRSRNMRASLSLQERSTAGSIKSRLSSTVIHGNNNTDTCNSVGPDTEDTKPDMKADQARNKQQGERFQEQQPLRERRASVLAQPGVGGQDEMLDLVYDPLLNCYYDHKTGTYYALKT